MTFDRSLLMMLVLTMVARLTHAPAHVCETLCIVSGFQICRLHPKALRVGASSVVARLTSSVG